MTDKRIETMLSQLITMVGNIREDQQKMWEEIRSMREDQQGMLEEQRNMRDGLSTMRNDNETRHKEILVRFTSLETDQELTWEKATRNEREIGRLKKSLQL
jgi:hypothetical protein